ncbi:MAG: hypothetical protein R3Y67_00940 [Eubacteriales bacterium]
MKLNNLDPSQKKKVCAFVICLTGVYLLLTIIFGSMLYNSKISSAESHENRMDPTVYDAEYPEGDYVEVTVGSYIESIRNVSMADSSFEAVFYIWFVWEGEEEFSPGDHFQIVSGAIEEKELVSEHYDDGQNYQRYKVTATLDKYYNLDRFSLEDHMLNIYIEDTTRDGSALRFVADTEETTISSRVSIPGFTIYEDIATVVKPHVYHSTYSSPSAVDGEDRVFSQYIMGISIARENASFYLRVLIPYVLSVLLALFALFSHRTDADSLGLSGCAFFGVVANAYVVSSLIPANGGGFGLLDMINMISLLSVLIVVAVSLFSLNARHTLEESGEEDNGFLRAIDLGAFISIGVGFLVFNLVLPFCAML